MLLTVEMLTDAINQLPSHRSELKRDLQNTLALVKRGIPVHDRAPVWKQAQNVIFVSKIDVDDSDSVPTRDAGTETIR